LSLSFPRRTTYRVSGSNIPICCLIILLMNSILNLLFFTKNQIIQEE